MLFRKMIRDLKEQKGSYLACITIIVMGLMLFTSFSMILDNLLLSQQNFYEAQNFADGFAELQTLPLSEISKLQKITGIKDIQGRLIKDVHVIFEGRDENIYLRLISVDTSHPVVINDMTLDLGSQLDPAQMNIWLDNKFFEANKLELGQEISVIVEGNKRSLLIRGIGKSPEYIYALRTSSDIYPNPKTFGIAFIPYDTMKTLFSEGNTVNNLVFTLNPGSEYSQIEQQLEPVLKPFGLKRLYARKDQGSHLLLTEELKGLSSMAKSLPLVFLSVAAMILYIMLKRMIERQREQIGTLKALGYSRKEISLHYLSYAFIVGIIGGIIGGLLGIALSYPFAEMYQIYFNMPDMGSSFSFVYFFISIALSLGFSLFAGYQGSKKALSLNPAEAMRPPAPPLGKNVIWEKVAFFWNLLTVQGKMALRSMSRNKTRTVFIFLGIMFTFALLCLPWTMLHITDKMLFDQFEKVQTYDVKMTFSQPLAREGAEKELSRFPGVKRIESLAEIPVTLNNDWLKKDVVIIGLSSESELYHILDYKENTLTPPMNGVLISERLAKVLSANTGTVLKAKSLAAKHPEDLKELEVIGIIPQYLGLNAYMHIDSLAAFLEQNHFATSLILSIDNNSIPQLEETYRYSTAITGVDNSKKMLQQFKDLMASSYGMIFAFALFGIITGFAVIYTSSLITLSERSRELASMMVLGMTPAEVLSVITFEQWFIAFFAMLTGAPVTKLMLLGMAESVSNDIYSMPAQIDGFSVLLAFIFTTVSIWFAQRIAAKKIKSLVLVEVLKTRE